eukprot:scaffold17.g462.t1
MRLRQQRMVAGMRCIRGSLGLLLGLGLLAGSLLLRSSRLGNLGGDAVIDRGSHEAQKPATETGSQCLERFPWVRGAVDTFYAPAWAAARHSTQSIEAFFQAANDTTWVDGYHPGHDEVLLEWDDERRTYSMRVDEMAKPNQRYKKDCLLATLRAAVEEHGAALGAALDRRALRFVVGTEDFGIVWRGAKWRLPAFALCTDDDHTDIPVPDFTFTCYPETRYKNSSWPAIQELLQRKSDMVPWGERHSSIFHRSNWGTYLNGSAGVSDVEALGAELDIEDTGFVSVHQGKAATKHDNFEWLDAQCDYKYTIHTAGFSYSAGLKYKLACGSLVFKFDSTFKEFYEPALQDGVHVVRLKSTNDGVDPQQFKGETVPRIKEVVTRTLHSKGLPRIAAEGQRFVREQLTPAALRCYWYQALVEYDRLFHASEAERKAGAAGGEGQRQRVQDAAKQDEQRQRRRMQR